MTVEWERQMYHDYGDRIVNPDDSIQETLEEFKNMGLNGFLIREKDYGEKLRLVLVANGELDKHYDLSPICDLVRREEGLKKVGKVDVRSCNGQWIGSSIIPSERK